MAQIKLHCQSLFLGLSLCPCQYFLVNYIPIWLLICGETNWTQQLHKGLYYWYKLFVLLTTSILVQTLHFIPAGSTKLCICITCSDDMCTIKYSWKSFKKVYLLKFIFSEFSMDKLSYQKPNQRSICSMGNLKYIMYDYAEVLAC